MNKKYFITKHEYYKHRAISMLIILLLLRKIEFKRLFITVIRPSEAVVNDAIRLNTRV